MICFKTQCARIVNQHGLIHNQSTDHPLTLSFTDLSVWCYKCENYIDNPILHKYKNLAHRSKFGEELVWSYGNQFVLNVEDSDDEWQRLRHLIFGLMTFLFFNLLWEVFDSLNIFSSWWTWKKSKKLIYSQIPLIVLLWSGIFAIFLEIYTKFIYTLLSHLRNFFKFICI